MKARQSLVEDSNGRYIREGHYLMNQIGCKWYVYFRIKDGKFYVVQPDDGEELTQEFVDLNQVSIIK